MCSGKLDKSCAKRWKSQLIEQKKMWEEGGNMRKISVFAETFNVADSEKQPHAQKE